MAAWERRGRPHRKAMDDRRRAIARSRLQAVALLAAGVVLTVSGMAPACKAMERKWGEIHCERLSPTVQSLEALVVLPAQPLRSCLRPQRVGSGSRLARMSPERIWARWAGAAAS
jgi:hypothetical protein